MTIFKNGRRVKSRRAWRGFKPWHEGTAYRLEAKVFVDRRSFISIDGHLLLAGADKTEQRKGLWFIKGPTCWDCGRVLTEEEFEWDHIKNKKGERCDCIHNGRVSCRTCHRKRHPQIGGRA